MLPIIVIKALHPETSELNKRLIMQSPAAMRFGEELLHYIYIVLKEQSFLIIQNLN